MIRFLTSKYALLEFNMKRWLFILFTFLCLQSNAYAQEWIEWRSNNVVNQSQEVLTYCDLLPSIQYQTYYWFPSWEPESWPTWYVRTSINPIWTRDDRITVVLVSEYRPDNGLTDCQTGWWDAFSVEKRTVADDLEYLIGSRDSTRGLFYGEDIDTGEYHWPPTTDVIIPDRPPLLYTIPDGIWTFNTNPDVLFVFGTIGDLAATDLTLSESVEITRTNNVVNIYIGPEFATSDVNRDGIIDITDIFYFLEAWFTQQHDADRNFDESVDVPDIFIFLSDWFARQ